MLLAELAEVEAAEASLVNGTDGEPVANASPATTSLRPATCNSSGAAAADSRDEGTSPQRAGDAAAAGDSDRRASGATAAASEAWGEQPPQPDSFFTMCGEIEELPDWPYEVGAARAATADGGGAGGSRVFAAAGESGRGAGWEAAEGQEGGSGAVAAWAWAKRHASECWDSAVVQVRC